MQAGSRAVSLIGQALALARGLITKHAIKQGDRMLSNNGIDVWDSFARWVPHQIAGHRDILARLIQGHGRDSSESVCNALI
jgi:hypothetical protein